jgi:acyl-CoA synthetase (AMP-forming)/AMP-acid ligase II
VPLHLDYGDTTALDLWERSVERHADRAALDSLGRVSTYAEVDDEVPRVAGGLHALGVRPGDIVALVVPNCPQNLFAFFARDQLTSPSPQVMQWAELASAAPLDESHPRPGRDDVALLLGLLVAGYGLTETSPVIVSDPNPMGKVMHREVSTRLGEPCTA